MLQNGKNYYFTNPAKICPADILRTHASSGEKKTDDMKFKQITINKWIYRHV